MTARVAAGLATLRLVAERADPTEPMTVGAIAAATGRDLSAVSRTCTELAGLDMLVRVGPPGGYAVGEAAIRLSGLAAARYARGVRFALTDIAQATGETACLAGGRRGDIRILASIASPWTLHAPASVGDDASAPDGAIARVMAGERGGADPVESELGGCVELAVPVLEADGVVRAVLAVRLPRNRARVGLPRARRALAAARRSLERALSSPHPVAEPAPQRTDEGALAAAFDLLRHLAAHPDTVTGAARAVGLRPDRAQRILDSCRRAGVVHQDDRRLDLDWVVHGWYRAAVAPTLVRDVTPLVAATADDHGVCTFITTLRGMRSVTLIEELRDVGPGLAMLPWLGRPAPLTESDGGPVLVMDLSDAELKSVFPRRHGTAEVEAFLTRVRRVVRDGVIAHESLDDGGVISISAPVLDASGTVAAAVCIVGPKDRVRPRLDALQVAARRLATDAGGVLLAPH